MNKSEEIKRIKSAIESLQSLLEEIESKQNKWEPKGGRWFLSAIGWEMAASTVRCRNYGIEFETEEAAMKAYKSYHRYHRLYKLAEELNEGWEPDWSSNREKLFVYYNHSSQTYSMVINNQCENIGAIWFKDKDTAQRAIEIIEQGGLDK